jgi:hypothetical protein
MKAITLSGHEVQFSAPDQDVYLDSMSMSGPTDVQPIFAEFVKPASTVIDVGANIGVTAIMSGFLVGGVRPRARTGTGDVSAPSAECRPIRS